MSTWSSRGCWSHLKISRNRVRSGVCVCIYIKMYCIDHFTEYDCVCVSEVRWRMEVHPRSHPVNQLEFDVIIGADGRRNTLPGECTHSHTHIHTHTQVHKHSVSQCLSLHGRTGFRRKEFRGKLAIAITANFMNRNTTAEAKVEEISGVAFIFNQKFFQELRHNTGQISGTREPR